MVRDRVNGSGVAISATLLALFCCVAGLCIDAQSPTTGGAIAVDPHTVTDHLAIVGATSEVVWIRVDPMPPSLDPPCEIRIYAAVPDDRQVCLGDEGPCVTLVAG